METDLQLKVLLVDDVPEQLDWLEMTLRDLGADLIRASSGKEAIKQVLDHEFALIVLDVRMPDMDGFEAARLIRQREKTRRIPIIFLTAIYDAAADVLAGYDCGAVDYIVKPISETVIRSKVSVFLDLARKAAELKERSDALEAANRDLESFSYSVSHDLRAPLRVISGFTQAFLADHQDSLDQDGRRQLNLVVSGARRMGLLIDDLLSFAHVASRNIAFKTLDMVPLVKGQWQLLGGQQKNRQVSLTIDELPLARGDQAMIQQVLANLLTNALKFTPADRIARIHVGCVRKNGETVYFVEDNGIGFDMEKAGLIFEPFQRLHSHREFEGTGIGLAIVRRIIEKHNGKVWAEAEEGKGATFYFSLPSARKPHLSLSGKSSTA